MKKIALSVLAVAVLVSCATQSAGPDLLVNVLSGSERKAAFVPPAHNRFPEGQQPQTLVWLSPEAAGRTEGGQVVSGFRFTSWRLEEGARVQVYALTGPAFSSNEKALKAVRIADFTVQPGSEVQIEQMSALGVAPMSLRVSEYGAVISGAIEKVPYLRDPCSKLSLPALCSTASNCGDICKRRFGYEEPT